MCRRGPIGFRRLVVAVVGGAVLAVLVLPVGARAQTAPRLATDRAQYLAGETIAYTGIGWDAGCGVVSVLLEPGAVFTDIQEPDATGAFTATTTAPDTIGSYLLRAETDGCGEDSTAATPPSTAKAPATTSATAELPNTGTTTQPLVALATVALALGAVLVLVRRRSV